MPSMAEGIDDEQLGRYPTSGHSVAPSSNWVTIT
jgi:hypothetical protein